MRATLPHARGHAITIAVPATDGEGPQWPDQWSMDTLFRLLAMSRMVLGYEAKRRGRAAGAEAIKARHQARRAGAAAHSYAERESGEIGYACGKAEAMERLRGHVGLQWASMRQLLRSLGRGGTSTKAVAAVRRHLWFWSRAVITFHNWHDGQALRVTPIKHLEMDNRVEVTLGRLALRELSPERGFTRCELPLPMASAAACNLQLYATASGRYRLPIGRDVLCAKIGLGGARREQRGKLQSAAAAANVELHWHGREKLLIKLPEAEPAVPDTIDVDSLLELDVEPEEEEPMPSRAYDFDCFRRRVMRGDVVAARERWEREREVDALRVEQMLTEQQHEDRQEDEPQRRTKRRDGFIVTYTGGD